MNSFYSARDTRYKSPYGAVPIGQKITFNLRPKRYFGVQNIELCISVDGGQAEYIKAVWVGLDGEQDVFRCEFTPKQKGLYWYNFRVKSGRIPYYINRGYGAKGEIGSRSEAMFQLTVFDGNYNIPSWFGEGITYNIFPDRFRRSKAPKKVGYKAERHIHVNWHDLPEFRPDRRGEILNNDFFGGDLQGVISKLDYLKELNITTIYLNPIFEAYSNHRYDTGDYKKIDPMLGTEEDFVELCSKAKEKGIKIILDGVFNHTGFDSRYFNGRGHYESTGAYQSRQSEYADWYEFSEWPNKYSSWWGIYTLPQIREESESYQKYMFEGEDCVIRRWLRLGASGWRLDVADEMPDWFLEKLNKSAREQKPDALILGEVWEDASNKIAYGMRRRYFQGDVLDSVMNYPLKDATLEFACGGTAEHFVEKIENIRENYPKDVFYSLMNLISTHDTPRVLTSMGCIEKDWRRDKEHRAFKRLQGDVLEKAKRLAKIAAIIQFTMPGSPCIYYGDEAGMQGFEDPFNRGTYPWDNIDEETLTFYKKLGKIRMENKAFINGDFKFLNADGGCLVFERTSEDERYIMVVNRSKDNFYFEMNSLNAYDCLDDKFYSADENQEIYLEIAPESAKIFRVD